MKLADIGSDTVAPAVIASSDDVLLSAKIVHVVMLVIMKVEAWTIGILFGLGCAGNCRCHDEDCKTRL